MRTTQHAATLVVGFVAGTIFGYGVIPWLLMIGGLTLVLLAGGLAVIRAVERSDRE